MTPEEIFYHLKCIRIQFDSMSEAIAAKHIFPYYKLTLSRWIIDINHYQHAVGFDKIADLKKELLEAYLSI